jgi:hypothetical protein
MRALVWIALLVACSAPKRPPTEAYYTVDGAESGRARGVGYKSAPMAGGSYNENTYALDDEVAASPPPPPPPPADPAVSEAPVEERMVHYAGWARLRVTRVQEALDVVAVEATARGGRVEQLGATSITVRVPTAEFDAAWQEIRGLGDVLGESVTAEDVTESFLAVDLRVKTLTVTRDRLVALLAKAESEQEKLALLHELQRVTEQLDQFDRQRRMLQGLADLARISVELVPREAVGAGATDPAVAGFEWIEQLSPFNHAIGDDKRLALAVPDGMVALAPKGRFVAESPEGAALWTGRVPNDPQADAGFWVDAVVDRLAADFATVERSTRGTWSCVTLVDGSDAPYTWDVCAQADPSDRYLSIAQAYYPTAEAVARYQAAVAASLSGGDS